MSELCFPPFSGKLMCPPLLSNRSDNPLFLLPTICLLNLVAACYVMHLVSLLVLFHVQGKLGLEGEILFAKAQFCSQSASWEIPPVVYSNEFWKSPFKFIPKVKLCQERLWHFMPDGRGSHNCFCYGFSCDLVMVCWNLL